MIDLSGPVDEDLAFDDFDDESECLWCGEPTHGDDYCSDGCERADFSDGLDDGSFDDEEEDDGVEFL